MLHYSALRSMNVMFATPTTERKNCTGFSASMFLLGAECLKVGLQAQLEMHTDSVVHYARNMLVAKFLASDCTHLFFWDHDNIPDNLMQVFRLLLADRNIVAGVPPIKKFNWPDKVGVPAGLTFEEWQQQSATYVFHPVMSESGHVETDEDGFAEVIYAGTGFMCIKRKVFEELALYNPDLKFVPNDVTVFLCIKREVFVKMMGAYPNLMFVPNGPEVKSNERLYWRFFQYLIEPETGRELPEDFSFCKMWRDLGGQIYEDTESRFGHYGEHIFRGDLAYKLEHSRVVRYVAA